LPSPAPNSIPLRRSIARRSSLARIEALPMLRRRGLSDSEIFAMLDDKPRCFLAGEPLPLPDL